MSFRKAGAEKRPCLWGSAGTGKVVPGAGLEPAYPKMRDFESRASTNFATPAGGVKEEEDTKRPWFGNCFYSVYTLYAHQLPGRFILLFGQGVRSL